MAYLPEMQKPVEAVENAVHTVERFSVLKKLLVVAAVGALIGVIIGLYL